MSFCFDLTQSFVDLKGHLLKIEYVTELQVFDKYGLELALAVSQELRKFIQIRKWLASYAVSFHYLLLIQSKQEFHVFFIFVRCRLCVRHREVCR